MYKLPSKHGRDVRQGLNYPLTQGCFVMYQLWKVGTGVEWI